MHPAIVIVVITGCFHLFRGAPLDAVVFLAVALWLAYAEHRWPADEVMEPVHPWTGAERTTAYAAVALAAAVSGLLPRYGAVDAVVICAVGFAALADAAARPSYAPPRRRSRGWPYAVIGVVAALGELSAYLMQTYAHASTRTFPALSDILNPVIAWPPTRVLLVALWLAGGVVLLQLMPARHRAHVEVEG